MRTCVSALGRGLSFGREILMGRSTKEEINTATSTTEFDELEGAADQPPKRYADDKVFRGIH
jgi:hypothetical protein